MIALLVWSCWLDEEGKFVNERENPPQATINPWSGGLSGLLPSLVAKARQEQYTHVEQASDLSGVTTNMI